MARLQSRPEEIANGHVLKTHSGLVLLPCVKLPVIPKA
jgi:hypothetical protein